MMHSTNAAFDRYFRLEMDDVKLMYRRTRYRSQTLATVTGALNKYVNIDGFIIIKNMRQMQIRSFS
jgi:hypothetical protein